MDCLECGADIGNSVGLCSQCQKNVREPDPADRAAQFNLIREASRPSVWQQVLAWLQADSQRQLNLIGAILLVVLVKFLVTGAGFSSVSPASFQLSPGVTVPEEPQQEAVELAAWTSHGWTILPRARFSIRARVLVVAHFVIGRETELSGNDFTLGWGPMSDTTILKQLSFTHGFRLVAWSPADSSGWPLDPAELNRHASNMHVVPASPEIAQQLSRLAVDDIVRFRGYLIQATAVSDGASWNSSLSREDTGNGACEVMWVEQVEIG